MTRAWLALAAVVLQRRRGDLRPARKGPVLRIPLPPGTTVEGLPLSIGGPKAQYSGAYAGCAVSETTEPNITV